MTPRAYEPPVPPQPAPVQKPWLFVLSASLLFTMFATVRIVHSFEDDNRARNISLVRAAFPHLAADDEYVARAGLWLSDRERKYEATLSRLIGQTLADEYIDPTTQRPVPDTEFFSFVNAKGIDPQTMDDATARKQRAWYLYSRIDRAMANETPPAIQLTTYQTAIAWSASIAVFAFVATVLMGLSVIFLRMSTTPLPQWKSKLPAVAVSWKRPAFVVFVATSVGTSAWAVLRTFGSNADANANVSEIGAVSVFIIACTFLLYTKSGRLIGPRSESPALPSTPPASAFDRSAA